MELPLSKDMKILASYIGTRVRKAINNSDFTATDLAKIVSEDIGLKESTTMGFISDVKSEAGVQYLPYKGKKITKQPRIDGAEKLMYLLHALNISKNDELISRIKKLYPHVNYPPK